MLFNSIAFLLFFPVICILYFLIPANKIKVRNGMLLIASYYFYMNWHAEYALLLLTSTVLTYTSAIGIEHFRKRSMKKFCLVMSLMLNLLILFMFKYFNFMAENIEGLMSYYGMDIELPEFSFLLPVGISFYTFQALGYSIDVYRGVTKVERDFPTYALFVSFFPQLVAGPIERSSNLLPQFKEIHKFEYERIMQGILLMLWGFFLKLVLADRCSLYVDAVYNNVEMHNGTSYLIASLFFPFQIYGDFAGYSLIAIGVAKVLGFRLMENFRRPYLSCSVGEFWGRWHISLSTWFRDYVYIPLGGNKVGKWRCYINLFITFVVSGIWHGANWTFVCWGALHGIILCVEKSVGISKKKYIGTKRFIHWLLTFAIVCIAWIFFRANNIKDAFSIILGIFTNIGVPYLRLADFGAIFLALTILLIKEVSDEWDLKPRIKPNLHYALRHIYIALLIAYIILFGVLGGDQFIYFQF